MKFSFPLSRVASCAFHRINIPPYGKYWKDFYLSSPSSVYRAVGELLFVGPSIEEALELAAKEK